MKEYIWTDLLNSISRFLSILDFWVSHKVGESGVMEPMISFFTITRRNEMTLGQKHPFLKTNEWFRIFGCPGSITSVSILVSSLTVKGTIFRTDNNVWCNEAHH